MNKWEVLRPGVNLILLYLYQDITLDPEDCSPHRSKCEALALGVHLVFLCFIRISLLDPEDFCFIRIRDEGWWYTFWIFNYLYNNMVYTSDIGVIYTYKYFVQNKYLGCLCFIFIFKSYPTLLKITGRMVFLN